MIHLSALATGPAPLGGGFAVAAGSVALAREIWPYKPVAHSPARR